MAKVSRSLLKGLVKECLVEILAEGLASSEPITESTPRRTKRSHVSRAPRKHPTDLMTLTEDSKKMNHAVQQSISAVAAGDSVMQDILADTASRTLPQMVAADNKGSSQMVERMARGDQATRAMATTDPMDLFEGSSNWATLAFPDAKSSTNS